VVKNARVVLAPLRFGAGLQALQAMVCGTPSVTTNIGAEAMFGIFNGMVLLMTILKVLNSAIELYQNQHSWLEHNLRELRLLIIGFQKNYFH
jgi:hypothetical protein